MCTDWPTCARGAVEQDASPRLEPADEELRVLERVHHGLLHQPLGVLQAQDLAPPHLRVLHEDLLQGGRERGEDTLATVTAQEGLGTFIISAMLAPK